MDPRTRSPPLDLDYGGGSRTVRGACGVFYGKIQNSDNYVLYQQRRYGKVETEKKKIENDVSS